MNDNETISRPSYNPADIQSKSGFYKFLIKKILQKIEKVAPAKIISYDRVKNRATVQILNQAITSEGEKLTRKPLDNIPVLMLAGGGFSLSFPIKKGDLGWIVAADRDISVFKQVLKLFAPATYQLHRYKNSFFIPDKVNGFEISQDDTDAVLLTSDNGSIKISIKADGITLTTATTTLKGDLTTSGTATAARVVSQNGVSGTFTNSVTVENGIVTGGS